MLEHLTIYHREKVGLVNSSSADFVYACSSAKLLLGKYISLGVALKSMIGSKLIANLLNRLGNYISTVTKKCAEFSLTSSNSLVPDQIIKTPELYTTLAWDKFDVNLETLSGADSVHHTYGIYYQNISSTIQVPQKITEKAYKERKIKDITSVLKEVREMELPPCREEPKMSYLEFTKIKINKPESLQITRHLDISWMISSIVWKILKYGQVGILNGLLKNATDNV